MDPDFALAWDEAVNIAADALEREAWRRAVEGFEEPVHYRGEVVGYVKKYSDRMLELLLKAHRPEKYRESGANVLINNRQQNAEKAPRRGFESRRPRRRLRFPAYRGRHDPVLATLAGKLQAKRTRGGHVGGHAPYGFRVVGKGRAARLEPVAGEQAVIERARTLRDGGMTFRAISAHLASEGRLSRSGRAFNPAQLMRMV